MKVSEQTIKTLHAWYTAPEEDVILVKKELLPHDYDVVKLRVIHVPHAGWFDIEIILDGFHMGYIIILTSTNEATYYTS